MTPRPRMPSLSLRPSLLSRASSHSNMLHARSPAGSPSPDSGGIERSSYFMTSASASPSAEMARYGGCTSNPWMNGPGSGYTPTSQLPPQQQQQQQQQQSTQQQQTQTQTDPPTQSHLPSTDTHTPTPLSALGGADIGSYFSPWSSECAHTPPLGLGGADGEVIKRSEQDGFFARGTTHTSSSISTSTATASTAAASAVSQIHLQHRHTHAQTHPNLRPPPPRSTVAFPLTMAVAQGKYHPSNYRNPSPPSTSSFHLQSTSSSPIITTTTTSPPSTSTPPTATQTQSQSPLSPPAQAPDTRRLLLQYQRDMVEAAARAAQLSVARSPASPRLGPLGSPGPVTPWELEGEGGGGGWLEWKGGDATNMAGKEGEEKGEA